MFQTAGLCPDQVPHMEQRPLACVALALGIAVGLPAQASVDWAVPVRGTAVAVDAADHVYTVDYDQVLGGELTLTRHDAAGNLVWTTSFDQTDPTKWEKANWVAVDSQGNALVCGTLMSGYSNPVVAASLLMKFAPSGALLWRQVYESGFDGSSTARCLVDEQDQVYVLGMGSGPAGFVTKVKKFDAAGQPVWTWYDNAVIGVAVRCKFAPNGDLLLVGRSLFGSLNGYARLGRDGALRWAIGGISALVAGDLASDVAGNLWHVDPGFASGGNCTVTRRDAAGAVLSTTPLPSAGRFLEIDGDGRAIVCGMGASGGATMFAVRADGTVAWQNLNADGPLNLLLFAQFLVDASGDAYLAAGTLFDMAVCKVRSDGSSAWTVTTPGSYANAFVRGRAQNGLYVVGGNLAHLRDPEEGQWSDLGFALPGGSAAATLTGEGVFQLGQPMYLRSTGAPPQAFGLWVAGLAPSLQPLLGGVLVPSADLVLGHFADPAGRAVWTPPVTTGLPTGLGLWLQAWYLDPSQPSSVRATNGLSTRTP